MRVGKRANVIGEKATLARHRLMTAAENDPESAGGKLPLFCVGASVLLSSDSVQLNGKRKCHHG